VVELIKEFCFKTRPVERKHFMVPTLANLYGLDMRFKRNDE
jgi:hypothetical protein